MKIISIDPGRMTGYCYARIKPVNLGNLLEFYPHQMMDEVDDFWRKLHEFKPDYMIMENFEFRGNARTGLDMFPKELIGVARLYEFIEPTGKVHLELQSAAKGKSYYTNPILTQNKWYVRGIPHGMDATRHLLQWATFGPGYKFNPTPVLLKEWNEERT